MRKACVGSSNMRKHQQVMLESGELWDLCVGRVHQAHVDSAVLLLFFNSVAAT